MFQAAKLPGGKAGEKYGPGIGDDLSSIRALLIATRLNQRANNSRYRVHLQTGHLIHYQPVLEAPIP